MGGILAMLLKFGPLVLNLLPHIPDVVNMVHLVVGPTQSNGPAKLDAAVGLAIGIIPELEDAFNLSPSARTIVGGIISLTYDVLKEQGKITGVVNPGSPVVAAAAAQPVPYVTA